MAYSPQGSRHHIPVWAPVRPALATARRVWSRLFAVALLVPSLALAASEEQAVELILSKMTFVGSDAGEPDMVLAAERGRIDPGSDVAHLEDVTLDAAGESGNSSLYMTCDRALLDLASGDFTANGNVRGKTADGHQFKTASARFEHGKRVIESKTRVEILDPAGTRLEGTGFRYDVHSQRMRMRNAVVSDSGEEPSP